jgi:hypothetical protein
MTTMNPGEEAVWAATFARWLHCGAEHAADAAGSAVEQLRGVHGGGLSAERLAMLEHVQRGRRKVGA